MKDHAVSLALAQSDAQSRLNILREYVQALSLRSLHESEAFASIAFVGGTALRFLRQLPRFSEDLDFTVFAPAGYAGVNWMRKLKRDLLSAGFDASLSWREQTAVHVAWIRIGQLLKMVGLSPLPDQKLSVKIEIDTHPPAGAGIQKRVIMRHVSFAISHHDMPSMMAGKLHALLCRPYVKGRDWYDLLWYLSQMPPVTPNQVLLQNALDQTQGVGKVSAASWRDQLVTRLGTLPFGRVAEDVRPFLERPKDAQLLTRENLLAALRSPA